MQKKQNEDAFFNKWMKQRESQGISLKKRIIGREKEGTKKIIRKKKVGGGEDEIEDEVDNQKTAKPQKKMTNQ